MAEVLRKSLPEIEQSDILQRLGLEPRRYSLLSAHREENIDTEENFLSLFTAINQMAEKYDMPILYSCHPRSRKKLEASGFQLDPRVIRHEPLGFHDYNHLQMNAFALRVFCNSHTEIFGGCGSWNDFFGCLKNYGNKKYPLVFLTMQANGMIKMIFMRL